MGDRVPRRSADRPRHRPRPFRAGLARGARRFGPAAGVRAAALRDGPRRHEATDGASRACRDRAQHVRTVNEPVPRPDVLAVARTTGSIWRVDAQPWMALLWGICAVGWVIALSSTFMIDHLDFLGLRQGGWARRGPLQFAVLRGALDVRLAATSDDAGAAGRLLGHAVDDHWAPAVRGRRIGYIALGVRFEERDLRRQLGDVYGEYARRVPRFVPRPPRSVPAAARIETKAGLS